YSILYHAEMKSGMVETSRLPFRDTRDVAELIEQKKLTLTTCAAGRHFVRRLRAPRGPAEVSG
ncbi:MAG: hypothetical protein AAFZ92_09030, partial [Pseudomonadota bacterium]